MSVDDGSSDSPPPHKILIHACESDNVEQITAAIKAAGLTGEDDEREAEPIARLIDGSTDPVGVPALHVAVRHQSIEAVFALLAYPIKIDIQDRDGNTPLHASIKLLEKNVGNAVELASAFVEAGTPVGQRNKQNTSAYSMLQTALSIRMSRLAQNLRVQLPRDVSPNDALGTFLDTIKSAGASDKVEDELAEYSECVQLRDEMLREMNGPTADEIVSDDDGEASA